MDLSKIMEYIDSLTEKKLIQVEVIKNEKGLMEEVVLLDGFYRKLTLNMVEEENEKSNYQSNIFEVVEKEFGRTLSPMEYEIIKAWLDNDMSEDLIKEAIKEAITESINSKDEVTLPGMGVFMEIIWNNATDDMKNEMLTILENNLKK